MRQCEGGAFGKCAGGGPEKIHKPLLGLCLDVETHIVLVFGQTDCLPKNGLTGDLPSVQVFYCRNMLARLV